MKKETIINTPLMRIYIPEDVAQTMTPDEWAAIHIVARAVPGRVYDWVHVSRLQSGALVMDEHVVQYEAHDGMGAVTPTVLCGIWNDAVWHEGHPLLVKRGKRSQFLLTRWGKAGGWRI